MIIDPQGQGLTFLKNLAKKQTDGFEIMKASDHNFVKSIEIAV